MTGNLDDPTRIAIEVAAALGIPTIFPEIPAQGGGEYTVDPISDVGMVTFSGGILTVGITNELPVMIDDITVRLKDNMSFDEQLSFTNVPAGSSVEDTIHLAGKTMSGSGLVAELVNIASSESPAPVPIDLDNDYIEFYVSATDILVESGSAVFPDQNFSMKDTDISFDVEGDEEITELRLSTGRIDYTINSGINEDIVFKIKLPATTINGEVFEDSIVIYNNTWNTGYFDLANSITDLTDGGTTFNTIPVEYEVNIQSSDQMIYFTSTDFISFDFSITDINFSYVEGYIGQQNIDIDEGDFDLEVDIFDKLSGSFTLNDPNLNIVYTNSIGVPVSFDLDIDAESSEGVVQGLNAGERDILAPADTVEGSVSDTIRFNKTNSDIVDFIALPPSKITYAGSATTNPLGKTGTSNFVTDESSIIVGVEMELPIELSLQNLTMQDTMEFEMDQNMDIEGSATLNIHVDNGFPFTVSFSIILHDTLTNTNLYTLDADLLESAVVTAGRVTQSTPTDTPITIDNDLFDNLNSANAIIVKGTISTYMNGTVPVKLYSDYSLTFSMVVDGEIKLNVKSDSDDDK